MQDASGCTDADFTPAATSPEAVGISPFSVAVGDFNLDGKPDLATANFNAANVTILLNSCNTPPAITALPVSQVADTSSTKLIATVSDPDQPPETLAVSISSDGVNFSTMASLNGITVSNLVVDTKGQVSATVAATCTASTASFTLKVTDNQGATATATLTVTVTAETLPPTLSCPAQPVTANTAPGTCQATVSFTVTATDNCDQSVTIVCQPPSGSLFPKGTTTVTCTATDDANNQSQCSFSVIVTDNENPQITCPANLTVSTDPNQCGAVVSYPNATATDNCPGVGTPLCNPPSGTFFAKGTTTVTCQVNDASGNQANCNFTVTVNDTQPPSITCPPNLTIVTATVNDPCTVVTFSTTASDNCTGVTTVCTPPSGSCFPIGVTCTATDASGNTASCSFTVSTFNGRLQDDSEGCANSLLFNTLTGDYRWCCHGTIFSGRGKVTKVGDTINIQHNPVDRRVLINLSAGSFPPAGTASLQSPPGTIRCVIIDRDTRNDTCVCGGVAPN